MHCMNLCSGCHFDSESVCTYADYAQYIGHMILNLMGQYHYQCFCDDGIHVCFVESIDPSFLALDWTRGGYIK